MIAPSARILVGDVRETLRQLPDASGHCCVTSPPYWRLRSYLPDDSPDKAAELGQEPELDCAGWATGSPCDECYVCHMVEVFRRVRRVLRDDGTLWLNLGDTSAASGAGSAGKHAAYTRGELCARAPKRAPGLKPKDTCLVPARVALALQADGWYLRRECIWAKGRSFDPEGSGSCMPSPATDAPTYSHEQIYLLSKRERYYYDKWAVAEPGVYPAGTRAAKGGVARANGAGVNSRPPEYAEYSGTRNLRSVWVLPSENETAKHYATFPSGLPRTCILAGTSERGVCAACGAPWVRVVERTSIVDPGARGSRFDTGKTGVCGMGRTQKGVRFVSAPLGWEPVCTCGADSIPATVLDPFSGLAKTGVVALRHGRSYIGCELSPEYAAISTHRLGRITSEVDAPPVGALPLGGLFREEEG